MVPERQARAKEVASSSNDQQKSDRDSVACVQVVSRCQCMLKNMLVKRGVLPLEVEKRERVAGRLALFLENWSKVTQDQWVLNTVQGYRIEFLRTPVQTTYPRVGVSSLQEQGLINEEIGKMLAKGAVTELPPEEAGRGFTRAFS